MLKKIKEIIAEQLWLKTNKIELDSKLERNLGADSLDMVEIVSRIEDEFSIEIPDEEFYSWKTVKDIMNYLEKQFRDAKDNYNYFEIRKEVLSSKGKDG